MSVVLDAFKPERSAFSRLGKSRNAPLKSAALTSPTMHMERISFTYIFQGTP